MFGRPNDAQRAATTTQPTVALRRLLAYMRPYTTQLVVVTLFIILTNSST